MKKLFFSLFSAVALLAVSCSEPYDDSALSGRIDNLESRVAQLEEMCRQINANIASLQTIVSALQNNDYITGVTAITENGETIGYKITFAKSKAITIYHGEDGKDGDTPIISVTQNNEGDYYWTINGSPIVNEYGYEITVQCENPGKDGADGKDGITPQLKIEKGYWYVSYDNGSTWTEVGKATGEDGKDGTDGSSSVFSSIDTSNSDYVIFTLADGTELAVPRYKNLSISFDIADGTACMPSASIKVGYTLTGADEETAIEIFNDGDWKSVLTKTDASSGYITVTAPANGGEGKVIMLAVNSMGFSAMKAICFEEGVVTGINDAYRVGYEESTLEVSLQTNLAYTVSIPDDAQSWISVADTRAEMRSDTLTFTILANPENSPKRSATIELLSNCDDILQSFVIMQDLRPTNEAIVFADANVKAVCVANFDTNGDGELSYKEAAAVTEIEYDFFGDYASAVTQFNEFQYFTSLKTLYSTFDGCSNLQSITIPESVTTIGEYAFSGCSSLQSVTIPESVTSIGSSAFSGCSSLQSVTIPESVTSISNSAFRSCSSLQSITIPDSVTSIGSGVFENCSMLQSITIPESVTSIGLSAFEGCSSLQSVTIPDGVTSIGLNAFLGCSSLQSVTIPDGVTSIGRFAFYGCSSLQSITIPASVTSIENNTFYGCSSLQSITIPDGVVTIKESVFNGCSSLQSVTIPESVVAIGSAAFSGCSNLQSITIPESVVTIEEKVFFGCSSLTAFYGKYASSDNRCLIVDGKLVAFAPAELTSYTIPEGVTSIGAYTFENCSSLQSITIPASVTSIGSRAFYNCSSLQSVTIPDGVSEIGDYAFYECSSLEEVYVKNPIPPTLGGYGYDVFGFNASGRKIYVPTESVNAYKAAIYWSSYADDIEGYDFSN